MKYVLICRDGKDSEAQSRRLAVREQHLKSIKENKSFVFGTAIIENEEMIGSIMVMDYQNEGELDEYLKSEVYATAWVWKSIEKLLCADGFFWAAFDINKT